MLVLSIAALHAGVVSAKPIEMRGTSGSIAAGSDMHLDGFNFPAFHYRIKSNATPESLDLHFISDGTIEENDAIYTTNTYMKSMRFVKFMGAEYRSLDPDKANLLSKILICFDKYDSPEEGNTKKILATGETWELKEGYSLVVSQIDLKGNKVYLNLYKNGEPVYDEVLEPGNYFMYNRTIDSVDDLTRFTCLVDSTFRGTDSNVVILRVVRQYSYTPKKIEIGQEYGDFEVKEITDKRIQLKNTNATSFSLYERGDLLGDWIKFRVSDKGWWGYAYATKECTPPASDEPAGKGGSPISNSTLKTPVESSTTSSTSSTASTCVVDTGDHTDERANSSPLGTIPPPRIRNRFRDSGFCLLSQDLLLPRI